MTPIEDCPDCGSSLEVPDEQVGDRVECPDCRRVFVAKALKKRPAETRDDDRPRRLARDDEDDVASSEEARPSKSALKEAASKKLAAGLCAILLGGLGIHKFILGFTTPGVIMLLVSVLTCGFASPVIGIIGLIEGILYLTKSDEEFHRVYMIEKKEWF